MMPVDDGSKADRSDSPKVTNPPEPYSDEAQLDRKFRDDLAAAIGDQSTVPLMWPNLEYRGTSAGDPEHKAIQWRVEIAMSIDEDEESEHEFGARQLNVGFLELITLPVDDSVAETLDSISVDTAEYLELIADGALSEEVHEQFDSPFITGLLILNRAYIHPALRGHNLGAWAVVQAIRHLAYGSITTFVIAYPTPTEQRLGVSKAEGAARLTQHWGSAGFEPIAACPKLVGQTTASAAIDVAVDALAGVAELELAVDGRLS
jgi:hypothetical protein